MNEPENEALQVLRRFGTVIVVSCGLNLKYGVPIEQGIRLIQYSSMYRNTEGREGGAMERVDVKHIKK